MIRAAAPCLLPLLALLMAASASRAQDRTGEQREPGALLTDAVLRLRAQAELVVLARIEHEKTQAKAPAGLGGVVMRFNGAGVDMREPFEGTVQAWRDPQGVTVIQSERALPGFDLYLRGEKTVRRITYDDRAPSLDQIEFELAALLETDRFVRHVMDAHKAGKFKATVQQSGDVTFRGPIAREIVRPIDHSLVLPGGVAIANFGPQAKVLKAEATFVVSRRGSFKSVSIKITRNDPMAEMMRGGLRGRIIVQGGGGVFGPAPAQKKKQEEKHDIEGGSTTYTLTFGAEQPSERARNFRRRIERMLGAAENAEKPADR